jgi:hypothetical protein
MKLQGSSLLDCAVSYRRDCTKQLVIYDSYSSVYSGLNTCACPKLSEEYCGIISYARMTIVYD